MTDDRAIDGRGMEPPQPLELTLRAIGSLPPNEELLLLLYCQPHPLFEVLKRNGYTWREDVKPDGTHEIRIRKA